MRTVMIASVLLFTIDLSGRVKADEPQTPDSAKGMMMLTIFLRHDESKTLDQINQHLQQTGFSKNFPPQGVEVVSWYVMMGIGQVVTLRFPSERLREVNLAVEHGAWGAFRTEFYATYDYKPVWEASRAR
jgi:hypothetical protein